MAYGMFVVTTGQLGGSIGEASPVAHGQLLNGVYEAASRTRVPLMLSRSPGPALLAPPHPQLCGTAQYSGRGKKEVVLLGSVPYGWGNRAPTQILLLPPVREITGYEGPSWL